MAKLVSEVTEVTKLDNVFEGMAVSCCPSLETVVFREDPDLCCPFLLEEMMN